MLQNPLVVLKKPSFYGIVSLLSHYCPKILKKTKVGRVKWEKAHINPTHLGGGGQNDPQHNKCLRKSENRKKKIKKTTNRIKVLVG